MNSPSASSKEWQRFFDAHAAHYDQNGFTQHTTAEVDFIQSLYPVSKGASIIDIGCGTGRHSVELAKRGYRVTGLDLSPEMLKQAKLKADTAEVDVNWIQADASQFEMEERFDAAICLCEGGVGLIEHGEDAEAHDLSIFSNIGRVLKPGAPFILTALNGYSIIRQMKDEHVHEGRFNPATMVANYQDEWDLPEGTRLMTIVERLFIPPEVVRLLRTAGFQVDNIYGGTAGHWAKRDLSLDEVEAMYLCRKKA